MLCKSCEKETAYFCCFQHGYCNSECQAKGWETHKNQCQLARSKVLSDENVNGSKQRFFLYEKKVASMAEIRVVPGKSVTKLRRTRPALEKMLSDQGITHLPKLEVLYGFLKPYKFLRKCDFSLHLDYLESGKERWQPFVSISSSRNLVPGEHFMNVTLRCLLGEIPQGLEDIMYKRIIGKKVKDDSYFREILRDPLSLYVILLLKKRLSMFDIFITRPRYNLEISSFQDYLRSKLKKLHANRMVPLKTKIPSNPRNSVILTVPDFSSELWPLVVNEYELRNDDSYDIRRLLDKKSITIIVKKNEYQLLGYVTCSLYNIPESRSMNLAEDQKFNDPNLSYFTNSEFKPDLFSIFSIDGLHISEDIRGGRENSIATILVFHVLYFIQECVLKSKEFGDVMVATNSAARSTLLIMKQFGFTYIDGLRLLGWLESDPNKRNLMSEVKYYIDQFNDIDPRLNELLNNRESDENKEAVKMIKLMSTYNHSDDDRYGNDMTLIKKGYLSEWDTFLVLSSNKENPVFEKEIERITTIVQGKKETEVKKTEKRTNDKELPTGRREKKAKFSVPLSSEWIEFI